MVAGGQVTTTEIAAPNASIVRTVNHSPSQSAIDIVVRWGDWVLSAHELSPPRQFVLGEESCDVTLPAEILGTARVPLLLARWDGDVRLIIHKYARVLIGGQTKRMSAARCIARGLAQASDTVPDAAEVNLLPGQTATLFFSQSVTIEVRRSEPAPIPVRKKFLDKRLALAQIGSLVFHAAILGVASFLTPIVDPEFASELSDDQKYELQERLNDAAEKEYDFQEDLEGYKRRGNRNERRLIAALARRQREWMEFNARGWTDELAAQASRNEAPRGTETNVMGVLYDWPKPEPATVGIASSARDSRPLTVTLPADNRPWTGRGNQVRMGAVTVTGRLPPEVIQRIVRQNFGRFRLCYENGLRNNPNLLGRVTVRFVIGRDGQISNVSNGGTDLPDGGVVSCVLRSFYGLSFPQPEGGIVTVVYPLMFAPGD